MKPEYHAKYKCRLCGQTYTSGATGSESVVRANLISLVTGCDFPLKMGIPMTLLDVHCCENGGQGIADFLGFDVMYEEVSSNGRSNNR